MNKYLFRYLMFWVPAALMVYLFDSTAVWSQVLQWFFGFFFMFGWSVNTGMAAYHYPRAMLSGLLLYSGSTLLVIVAMYSIPSPSMANRVLRQVGGALSFRPLEAFRQALLDFTFPQEVVVVGVLVFCCFTGYLVGVCYRRVRPDPYQPRIKLD